MVGNTGDQYLVCRRGVFMRYAFLFSLILLLSGCGPAMRGSGDSPAVAIDLCSVFETPEIFNGKLVSFPATLRPATHYNILIVGEGRCKDRALVVIVPSSLRKDRQVQRLRDILFAGYPESANSAARACVTGYYSYNPDDGLSRHIIYLAKISEAQPAVLSQ